MPDNVAWIIVAALCSGIIAAVLWVFLVPPYERWWIVPFAIAYCATIAVWMMLV